MAKSRQNPTATPPAFAELQHTGDPTQFKVPHGSDTQLYNLVNKKLLQPFPPPRIPGNLILTLEQVLGADGTSTVKKIRNNGKIVFHAVGDTGSTKGPNNQNIVADKLSNDFVGEANADVPSFMFHLGDVVYSFGEGRFYYDQFYDQYRNYPAPIVAIPGNHDGLVYKGDDSKTLEAFLRNFVTDSPQVADDAMGLRRTTMIQPGVYFAFDAPFVSIIGLYSNVLEDPGIISTENGKYDTLNDDQLEFLTNQLKRVKGGGNAVIVAVHHPPYTGGKAHKASPRMLQDLEDCCKEAKFWPHAFLCGHAHNYQRFTRVEGNFDIPFIVCGNSGHNVSGLMKKGATPLRTPNQVNNQLTFENYDDTNYGYLRITVDSKNLRIEYHDANANQKTESDVVTIDLKSHKKIAN
ncbi:MAG: metallophosphoesterase family protein [Chitinophagales bacterium]